MRRPNRNPKAERHTNGRVLLEARRPNLNDKLRLARLVKIPGVLLDAPGQLAVLLDEALSFPGSWASMVVADMQPQHETVLEPAVL